MAQTLLAWGVSDNGLVRLYRTEARAREEYMALRHSVRENKYFHPSYRARTEIYTDIDSPDNHYICYTAKREYEDVEYRQAWYGKLIIND